jgi:hypothetical protein
LECCARQTPCNPGVLRPPDPCIPGGAAPPKPHAFLGVCAVQALLDGVSVPSPPIFPHASPCFPVTHMPYLCLSYPPLRPILGHMTNENCRIITWATASDLKQLSLKLSMPFTSLRLERRWRLIPDASLASCFPSFVVFALARKSGHLQQLVPLPTYTFAGVLSICNLAICI